MVFEQISPLKLLEYSPLNGFSLGLIYGFLGIGIALLLFPEGPAIVSVALIAILAIPTISKMLREAEFVESKRDHSNILMFFRDHKHIFIIYATLFLGIFIAFAISSIYWPNYAINHIFQNQIEVHYGKTGGAILGSAIFERIFSNNLSVLVVCFLTALILGDGAMFLITWNASVWGTIFGTMAKTASLSLVQNPYHIFALILLTVFPHMMLEASGYFAAAGSGGILSKSFIKEKFLSENFFHILRDVVLLLLLAGLLVFIGAYVETYVLNNADTYRKIIAASFR